MQIFKMVDVLVCKFGYSREIPRCTKAHRITYILSLGIRADFLSTVQEQFYLTFCKENTWTNAETCIHTLTVEIFFSFMFGQILRFFGLT